MKFLRSAWLWVVLLLVVGIVALFIVRPSSLREEQPPATLYKDALKELSNPPDPSRPQPTVGGIGAKPEAEEPPAR